MVSANLQFFFELKTPSSAMSTFNIEKLRRKRTTYDTFKRFCLRSVFVVRIKWWVQMSQSQINIRTWAWAWAKLSLHFWRQHSAPKISLQIYCFHRTMISFHRSFCLKYINTHQSFMHKYLCWVSKQKHYKFRGIWFMASAREERLWSHRSCLLCSSVVFMQTYLSNGQINQ